MLAHILIFFKAEAWNVHTMYVSYLINMQSYHPQIVTVYHRSRLSSRSSGYTRIDNETGH